ncbi:MAG: hypothetical protein H6850_01660 [Alphaproteobacteria bacterium]|nr:MAG: hypothetical protein H6850_01660 [Alphaproteobacteria bacterium]
MAKYILIEGETKHPKQVITYYMSPLCKSCFKFHKNPSVEKDTMIIYQPVLMGDHDEALQIFVLSLIKKFRISEFWHISEKFYKFEQDPELSPNEIAQKLGFSDAQIKWMKNNISYQKMVHAELKNPIEAKLVDGEIQYMVLKDEEIGYVPMIKRGVVIAKP